jgi:hypothetical protein
MTIANNRMRIAGLCPANTTENRLYLVPASTQIDAVLRIVNLDTTSQTYRLAHTATDVAATTADYLAYNMEILAGDTHEWSIHANAAETIRVLSSTASKICYHLSGNKKTW